MVLSFSRAAALVVAAATLASCSGGGGSGPGAPTSPTAAPSTSTPSVLSTAQLNGAPAFVDAASRSIYIFDADLAAPGTSTCYGACASVWPHVTPPNVPMTAGFATLARTDGTTQLTYNGHPLYTFAGDTAAGQANGDGLTEFGGLWHLSRPAGSSSGTSPNPPSNPY